MGKHENFAKREWEWMFLDNYRPSEYGFEVGVLEHVTEKQLDMYRQKIAEARARHEVIEPEVVEEVDDIEEA